ncbi:hypothetical protein ACHWQZ_G006476 [Mnemiopsis leidyi]
MFVKTLIMAMVPFLISSQTAQLTGSPRATINAIVIEAENITSSEDCFIRFREPDLLTSIPDHMFKVSRGREECLECCRLMKKCLLFYFNHHTQYCYTFSNTDVLSDARKTKDAFSGIGQKGCFKYFKNCSDIEFTLAATGLTSGIILKAANGRKCFNVAQHYIRSNGHRFRAARWDGCRTPDRWNIAKIPGGSEEYLSIAVSLEGTDECLSNLFSSNTTLDILYLTTCQKDDPSQQFSLMKDKYVSCAFFLGNSSSTTNTDMESQTPRFFRDILFSPAEQPKVMIKKSFTLERALRSPCRMKEMTVQNGFVLHPENLPFFLPGSSMTLRCKPGYGFKDGDSGSYTTEVEILCQHNLTSQWKCSPMHQERELLAKNTQNVYYPIVVVLSVGLVFVLVSALIERYKMRKKIVKLREAVQENQGGRVTTATLIQDLNITKF